MALRPFLFFLRTSTSPLLPPAALLLVSSSAFAQVSETPELPPLPPAVPAPQTAEEAARDTNRLVIGIAGLMYASYPLSIEDPGPALLVGKPLWLGHRYRFFQWVADAKLLAGFGTSSRFGHLSASPQFGFELFLGPWFGFDLHMGPVALLQVGSRTVAGAGIASSGGYVFRFWDDDRRRLKLEMILQSGGYFARDPGNDLGTNAGGLGGGLVFETPL